METVELEVTTRDEQGTAQVERLRKTGFVPAVVYAKGLKTQGIKIAGPEFSKKASRAGHSRLFRFSSTTKELNNLLTLIKDVQVEPISQRVVHVDFLAVTEGTKIRVTVPVELTGMPAGVKAGEADLIQTAFELEVLCIPSKIPARIDVNVDGLTIGHSLHASDIQLPEDVKLVSKRDQSVATVVPKRAAEEPTAAAAATPAEGAAEGAAPAAEGAAPAAEGADKEKPKKEKGKDKD